MLAWHIRRMNCASLYFFPLEDEITTENIGMRQKWNEAPPCFLNDGQVSKQGLPKAKYGITGMKTN